MAVQLGEQRGVDLPARGAQAVAVEGLGAVGGGARDGVERHVAGGVVEGDQVGEPLAHQRDVGDAADVLHGALASGCVKQQVVGERARAAHPRRRRRRRARGSRSPPGSRCARR